MKPLTKEDINKQSVGTWTRWKHDWINNSIINKNIENKEIKELLNYGEGKNLLQVAFGNSLKQNIDKIKEISQRDDFDIFCCDKAFGYLMENKIIPDFCLVADANIDDIWFKEYDTSNTRLIANISSNPKWTQHWKGEIYFYVNWDSISTAKIIGKIGNCYDVIPAASNVSNAQVVFANQIMDYNWQVLVGFDYSWKTDKYYAIGDYKEKKAWMNHMTLISKNNEIIQTSVNLMFSAQWMSMYLQKTKAKVINCSNGFLQSKHEESFENAIKIIEHEKEVNIKWQ
jgi:hypothetical protein